MIRLMKFTTALIVFLSTSVSAKDLSLAYFMSPKHPMNAAVFTPFAENLVEISGGKITVTQFAGGALNSSPPNQYSILLNKVADIAFVLPGYTAEVFPKTNLISLPNVCEDAVSCTQALQNARTELEREFDAKVLALWANSPPVLITRDKAVRSIEDIQGMKIRVTSKQDIPFVEALGATAVAQPVTMVNQNLTNGVIDAVLIDPSGIRSFKLNEPANYITTWFPVSGAAFVLLMNRDVYEGLTDQEKSWVDEASNSTLSTNGGAVYGRAGNNGIKLAIESGVEIIDLTLEEKALFNAAISPVLNALKSEPAGDKTVEEVLELMGAI